MPTMPTAVLSPLPQLPLPGAGYYLNVHDFSGAPSHATSQATSPGGGSSNSTSRSNSSVHLSHSDSMRSPLGGLHDAHSWGAGGIPPSIISPAFTPLTSPGTPTPAAAAEQLAVPAGVDEQHSHRPVPRKLMKQLPEVTCIVRARIPTCAAPHPIIASNSREV